MRRSLPIMSFRQPMLRLMVFKEVGELQNQRDYRKKGHKHLHDRLLPFFAKRDLVGSLSFCCMPAVTTPANLSEVLTKLDNTVRVVYTMGVEDDPSYSTDTTFRTQVRCKNHSDIANLLQGLITYEGRRNENKPLGACLRDGTPIGLFLL